MEGSFQLRQAFPLLFFEVAVDVVRRKKDGSGYPGILLVVSSNDVGSSQNSENAFAISGSSFSWKDRRPCLASFSDQPTYVS